jgi:hypothetical protein
MIIPDAKTKVEEFEEEMDAKGLNKEEILAEEETGEVDLARLQARIIEERAFVKKQNQNKSGGNYRTGSPGRVRARKR